MFRSISSGTYLFNDILVVEHTKAGSWHGHFRELEANIFRRKSPCLEQIRTWIFLVCDWPIKIQARNLQSFEFQNEASDVTLGNPMAVHLNLTADPVVVSQRSSRGWTSLPHWAARSVPLCQFDKSESVWASLQLAGLTRHFHARPLPNVNKYGRHLGFVSLNLYFDYLFGPRPLIKTPKWNRLLCEVFRLQHVGKINNES